jgi:type II secretory pathway component PulM
MYLSAREKALLAAMAALLVLGGALLAWRAVQAYERELALALETTRAQLRQAEALRAEWERLRRAPVVTPLQQPLLGYLEGLAREAALGDRLQLNLVTPDRARALEAVEIKLDALTLDEMIAFIHRIESAPAALIIDHFEVTRSFRSRDLLRVTLRVLARK